MTTLVFSGARGRSRSGSRIKKSKRSTSRSSAGNSKHQSRSSSYDSNMPYKTQNGSGPFSGFVELLVDCRIEGWKISFFKETDFCYVLKKHKNPILNCFYCIMQYHYFQNYTIKTCCTHYGFQNWGQRNVSRIFVFAVLLVSSLHHSGGAWQTRAQRTAKSHSRTNPYSFMSSLCACPVGSASIQRIFST